MNETDLVEWKQARKDVGWQRYGEKSYCRYNLVDVMEELMDAEVILERFKERLARERCLLSPEGQKTLAAIIDGIAKIQLLIVELDKALPDGVCTDEAAGERIWWPSSRKD